MSVKKQHSKHIHETLLSTLRERGYRLTAPRRAIIAALESASEPKTVQQLMQRTRIKDASTVYRTLRELQKEQLLEEFTDRGTAFYEVVHVHHDHAVCGDCGTIRHIPCASKRAPAALRGWTHLSHESLFRGVCEKCSASK
jgi:Fe2+ or Zn2+ uptake regulation protein